MELAKMHLKSTEVITEPGLKELVEQSTTLYNSKFLTRITKKEGNFRCPLSID
jgi:hypothetical protein